ncbi:Protein of unknown function, DUF600 [Pedobacter sp. ok626]|uniref:immunity protein YezG family protein n=1 Tax=Pedobacter sp. ok626 TaxID=1761882 RepID=UPI00088C81F5|nr:immunity protein YezG family protein [Pedobacter sp. ok626]SDK12882.1 Protein of unknown function, DUF600 [Pedobacter sp. ok626]
METINEIYLNIAQGIVNAIEEDNWTNALLEIEIVGTGVVGYSGAYNIGETNHDMSVRKMPRDIRNWIRELHAITTKGGNNKWNRAVFSLKPDGKFDMEFIWDQVLQDEIERLAKS